MNTDKSPGIASGLLEADLTERILAAAFKVQNALGCGFLEKVYENAMVVELKRGNLVVEQQQSYNVCYEGVSVGQYVADLVVAARVVVECKAVQELDSIHEAQLLNYLKATGIRVGLLLNFGRPKVQFRRLVA